MKTTTKFIALILAAGSSSLALASLAGVPLPAFFSIENLVTAFTSTFAALIVIADYSPRTRRSLQVKTAIPCCSTAESHRLAA
jgi:hypothetical protein